MQNRIYSIFPLEKTQEIDIIYYIIILNLHTVLERVIILKIAVITGASSGLGEEYALKIDKMRNEIDEIWLIARREERLLALAKKLNKKTRTLTLDITKEKSIEEYKNLLTESGGEVKILINNAGCGKLGDFDSMPSADSRIMVSLNCEALTVTTSVTLPFMKAGGEILNSCSIASFAPNSRMAVYSSTKAYVMSFSRALRNELKPKKINVLAVCPGPMDTEFLGIAGIEKGTSRTFDTLPRVNPSVMAEKSLIASKKAKAVYTNRIFYKFYRILAKVLPHSIVMLMAKT